MANLLCGTTIGGFLAWNAGNSGTYLTEWKTCSLNIERTGAGEVMNIYTTDGASDLCIRYGYTNTGGGSWLLKYNGSTVGTGGNEFRVESESTGCYYQYDHNGNFEVLGAIIGKNGGGAQFFDGTGVSRLTTRVASTTLAEIYYYDEAAITFRDLKIGSTTTNNGIYLDQTNNRVGIFDDTPSYTLDVAGHGRFTTCSISPIHCSTSAFRTTGSGYRFCGGTGCGCAVDWVATSDYRIKKNITPIIGALSKITSLCGVCYDFCENDDPDMGLIAQDVLKIEPRLVNLSDVPDEYKKYNIEDSVYGLKYDKFAGLFVEAIKEQQTCICSLSNKLESTCCELLQIKEELNNIKNKIK